MFNRWKRNLSILLFVSLLPIIVVYEYHSRYTLEVNQSRKKIMKKFREDSNMPEERVSNRDHNSEEMPSVANETCQIKSPKLADHNLTLTALASYPRSGNTWLRHLIQQLSGLATTSVYCDYGLRRRGFPFECQSKYSNRVIVTKTHKPLNKSPIFERAVVLIRNPFSAIYSFFHFRKTSGHVGNVDLKTFQNDFHEFAELQRVKWEKFHLFWLSNFTGPIHIILYHDLIHNLNHELTLLARFLGIKYTTSDMKCTLQNQQGRFNRNDSQVPIQSVFSRYTETLIQNVSDKIAMILSKKYKYDKFKFLPLKELKEA